MKEIKNVTVTLAADVYLAHMKGEKDGKPYEFISTRVRDAEGHVHGIAIQPQVWNALTGCSVLDTVKFVGTLLIPEGERKDPTTGVPMAADDGYAESVVTRKRTGETYVSGDFVDAKPVAVEKSVFPAENFARCEDIPVYVKQTQAQAPIKV